MTKLKQLKPLLLRSCNHRFISKMAGEEGNNNSDLSTAQNKNIKASRPMYSPEPPLNVDDIDEPTNCCMSGCANCVWIEYAEKLSTVLQGSQKDVQKLIMDKVQDQNMRAFLSMELRVRKIIE